MRIQIFFLTGNLTNLPISLKPHYVLASSYFRLMYSGVDPPKKFFWSESGSSSRLISAPGLGYLLSMHFKNLTLHFSLSRKVLML
jgi:hypothetical protein